MIVHACACLCMLVHACACLCMIVHACACLWMLVCMLVHDCACLCMIVNIVHACAWSSMKLMLVLLVPWSLDVYVFSLWLTYPIRSRRSNTFLNRLTVSNERRSPVTWRSPMAPPTSTSVPARPRVCTVHWYVNSVCTHVGCTSCTRCTRCTCSVTSSPGTAVQRRVTWGVLVLRALFWCICDVLSLMFYTLFTYVYLRLLTFTYVYLRLLTFTYVYLHVHLLTCTCMYGYDLNANDQFSGAGATSDRRCHSVCVCYTCHLL